MRRVEVQVREIEHIDEDSLVSFSGQRALVFDSVAAGEFKKQLIEAVGFERARTMLVRLGHSQGLRLGAAIRDQIRPDEEASIEELVSKAVSVGGTARVTRRTILGSRGMTVEDSYEVEHYTSAIGRATEPVCWALCGLVGGLATSLLGSDYIAFEDRCVAKGDSHCRLFTRPGRPDAFVPSVSEIRPLAEIEREYILSALDKCNGNQTRTAKELGIGSATLYRKLQSYRGSRK